jgi:hypothetical protein
MAEAKSGAKWLKCGCLGCLGVLAIIIVILVVLLVVARMKVRSEEVAEPVLTPQIPVLEQPVVSDAETTGAGTVVLDLSRGGFFVEPAPPGEPLHVEARYDRKSCELRENLEQGGDAGWTYRLSFSCSGYSLTGILKRILGGTQPEVRVYLPPDQPLNLDFVMSMGGSQVELGGLWLKSADFNSEMGGIELSVDQPLRAPMERMTFSGSMGGIAISSLGNASPRSLDVDFKMGGLVLDLRGRWLQDSDITIEGRMGGGVVQLPRDVLIEGLDAGRIESGESPEIKPPTLRFSTKIEQGELDIVN